MDRRIGNRIFHYSRTPDIRCGGIQVFAAEASGPTHDKVHPRIGITAKWIWGIYAGLTGTLIILLMFGGMNIFDSICHAFATTSTGVLYQTGQHRILSLSLYRICDLYLHVYIRYQLHLIIIVRQRKAQKFVHDAELKWYFWSVTGFTIVIAAILYYNSSMGVEEAFRKSLFQVASLHTSTGFATADYMTWPAITWGMLTVIMIMGACAGSTTGGIKSIRLVILAKVSRNEFKHIIHPNAVLPVRVNKQVISPSIRSTVLAFTFLYTVLIIAGTLAMLGLGVGLTESLGCTISSLGNMGPGLGLCGPAYSWNELPDAAKWLMSFLCCSDVSSYLRFYYYSAPISGKRIDPNQFRVLKTFFVMQRLQKNEFKFYICSRLKAKYETKLKIWHIIDICPIASLNSDGSDGRL